MKKLFQEKECEKVATVYLDKDSTTWVKSIITEFLTQFPQLQNQAMSVTWKKKDTAKGYAVGALNVLNGSVPVIIKDFNLYPLDIIMFGNAAMPLTTETLGELFTSANAFKGITAVQPKSSLNIFGDSKIQWSPVDGVPSMSDNSSVTRDAVKVASFIDKIEHIDKDSVKIIFEEISKNNLLPKFESNNTLEVLEKLSSRKFTSPETEIESYLRELEIDRQYTFEDEYGNKFIKQASSKVDYTWKVDINDDEAQENMLSSEKIAQKCGKTSKKVQKGVKVAEKGHFEHNNEKTADFEVLDVINHKKLEKFAYFLGNDPKFAICVDKNGNWSEIDPKFAKKAQFNTEIDGVEPNLGDFGILVNKNGSTRPFEIIGITKNAEAYEIDGQDWDGITRFTPSNLDNGKFWNSRIDGITVFVPNDAKFVKLGKKIEDARSLEKLAESSALDNVIEVKVLENLVPKSYYIVDLEESDFSKNYISKNAEFVSEEIIEKIGSVSFELVGRDSAGLFYFQGPSLDKYAAYHPNKNLSKNDLIWSLVHCGVNESEIEKVSSLHYNESMYLDSKISVPICLKDLETRVNENYEKMKTDNISLNKVLVKEASAILDKTTVDAILSLGLMKKYNIMEFINLIPEYEMVTGELAKLLTMIRLGLTNLPEEPVKTAMETLATTTILLKQLQRINK